MNIQRIQERLTELEDQIRKSYKNASILDDVCAVERVEPDFKLGAFEQFAGRYLIERAHILDQSHVLLLGELGLSVARSEISLLLQKFAKNAKVKQSERFSIQDIKNTVYELQASDFFPSVVFIPSEFFHEVFEWNQQQSNRISNRIDNPMHSLFLDPTTILKVKYSSKYAEFDNVIITTKQANLWQHRPDNETGERITAKFDWNYDDAENTVLSVKTVFNFQIQSNEANVMLKLPHNSKEVEDNNSGSQN